VRRPNRTILTYRALFGGGFVVLGLVTLWRIVVVPAPSANKLLGLVLAAAMIALGVTRIAQYLRDRGVP